jgi:hypothetical protein
VVEKGNKRKATKAGSVRPPYESGDDKNVGLKTAGVLTASSEQFEQAQRKTSKLHTGLFRRLSK